MDAIQMLEQLSDLSYPKLSEEVQLKTWVEIPFKMTYLQSKS